MEEKASLVVCHYHEALGGIGAIQIGRRDGKGCAEIYI